MRLFLGLFVSLLCMLSAQDHPEVIAAVNRRSEHIEIKLESGNSLWLKNNGVVLYAMKDWKPGDQIEVAGENVATVKSPKTREVLIADREIGEKECKIETWEVVGLRRSGTGYLKKLLQRNFPSLKMQEIAVGNDEMRADMVVGSCNLAQVRKKLLQGRIPAVRLNENHLIILAVRNPYDWLQSLYRVSRLPFKQDPKRGFTLFLSGKATLPKYMDERKHPFTGEPFAHPLQSRRVWLTEALYLLKAAPNVCIVDYEMLVKDPAAVLAQISCAHNISHMPYFKSMPNDTSGLGVYEKPGSEFISVEQQERIDKMLDKRLEKRFGSLL